MSLVLRGHQKMPATRRHKHCEDRQCTWKDLDILCRMETVWKLREEQQTLTLLLPGPETVARDRENQPLGRLGGSVG